MRLNSYFSDGAILQQNKEILISGISDIDEQISIRLLRDNDNAIIEKKTAFINKGVFFVLLDPIKASFETYTLFIEGADTSFCIKDIVVGDVFLTSGQSNMAFGVDSCIDRDEILDTIKNCRMRFMICGAKQTENDFDICYDGWKMVKSADDVSTLTAIGAVFAACIENNLDIPIGIIHAAVGGTPIETWMSRTLILSDETVKNSLVDKGRFSENNDYTHLDINNCMHVSKYFNERIKPLSTINIKAILWLQGESSAKDEVEANFYKLALDLLIDDWSKRFRGDIPFFIVDIAAQNYQFAPLGVAYLNEAIQHVVEMDSQNRAHVPIYDLPLDFIIPGDINSHPIHPAVKAPVGKRLADVTLNRLYAVKNGCEVPTISEIKYDGKGAVLTFDGVADGLKSLDSFPLQGFTVCGRSRVHIEASAKIIGKNKVSVWSEFIDKCEGVTYAFSLYNQKCNLSNSGGIPGVPFRSESHNDIYFEPRYWMCCDYKSEWENCFEWPLGGANEVTLWNIGTALGTPNAKISFNNAIKSEGTSSIQLDYNTELKYGYFVSVSPKIVSTGKFHALDRYETMYVDIKNPDDRVKTFYGVLVKAVNGKVYRLAVYNDDSLVSNAELPAKSEFETYSVSLKKFLGCDSGFENKMPPDMSDIYEMFFVFLDNSDEQGTLYIDNIKVGF